MTTIDLGPFSSLSSVVDSITAPLKPLPGVGIESIRELRRLPNGRFTALTPECQEAIARARLHGSTVASACEYGNISKETYYVWQRRGAAYLEHLSAGGERIPEEEIFGEFTSTIRGARASCEVAMADMVVRKGMEGDWRAALEWLRANVEGWNPRRQTVGVEVSGPGGGPIMVEGLTEIEAVLAERVTARLEAARESEWVEEAVVVSSRAVSVPVDDDDEDWDPYAFFP